MIEEVWIEATVLACSQTLYFPFRDRRVQTLLTASTRGWGWGKEKIDTLARFPIVNNNNNNNNNKGRKRLWTGYCIAIVQGPRCTGNTFQMIYCFKRFFFGITFKTNTLKGKIKPWKKCSVLFKLIRLLCSNYMCTSLAFDGQNGNGLQFSG